MNICVGRGSILIVWGQSTGEGGTVPGDFLDTTASALDTCVLKLSILRGARIILAFLVTAGPREMQPPAAHQSLTRV
jgi:hypothetical protein